MAVFRRLGLGAVLLVGAAAAHAGEKVPALPPVLQKGAAPADVKELRDIERQVAAVIAKVTPAVVGVRVGPGQGSGVIVDPDGTILTAGHVSGQPGRDATVLMPDGTQYKAKTLGRNNQIDSGMMKIVTDKAIEFPHVEIGKSGVLKKGQWVVAIGHPGGFRTNRTPVVRVGRILRANPFEVQTDCTLVGGDSGGPLFDMTGRVVGIHSRIGGQSIAENVHVPIDTYRQTWDRLAKGEAWGGALGQPIVVKSAGGSVVFEKKDRLTEQDERDKVLAGSYRKVYPFQVKAGSTYTIDLDGPGRKFFDKFDPFLRLEDPAGKQLAENDDRGPKDMNSRIVYRAVRDGEVRIVATTFESDQTGAFALKVYEADAKETFQAGPVDVLRAVKVPKQIAAQVAQKFARAGNPLFVTAHLADAKGKPAVGTEAVFAWAGGREAFKADDQGVVRFPLKRDRVKKLTLELPAGTKALLAVTDAQGAPAGLRFGPNDLAKETVPSAGGEIVFSATGKLEVSDPFDREKASSHHKVHELKLKAGATYTFDLESDEFDPFLRLEDAKGERSLADDDDGAGYLNARVVFRSTRDETVRVIVTSFDGDQTGAYRLTAREKTSK